MKRLIVFLLIIFIIALTAGAIHYYDIGDPKSEPEIQNIEQGDTTEVDIPQDNLDMYITIMVLEQIQNSQNL